MAKYKVFIGFDSTNYGQELAYEVCKRSILKHNPSVEIHKLYRKELIDKKLFWRKDNTGVTEFTYTRFLVPYLCDYEGYALFCDSDFLWTCDVAEVFNKYCDSTKAVSCVKHNYTNCNGKTKMDGRPQEYYPRKNWSSLMLFNCSHTSTKNLTLNAVSSQSPAWLHRMQWAKDEEIGEINKRYNYLVDYYHDDVISALHYTDGGPWHPNYEHVEHGDKWMKYLSPEETEKMCKERYL